MNEDTIVLLIAMAMLFVIALCGWLADA